MVDHMDENSNGYVAFDYADEAPADLRLECHDCGEIWFEDNTESGLTSLERIESRHVDDGPEVRAPCGMTRILAVWADGSTAEV
jgi:hypothetical protein